MIDIHVVPVAPHEIRLALNRHQLDRGGVRHRALLEVALDGSGDLELAILKGELLEALQCSLHLSEAVAELLDLVARVNVDLLVEVPSSNGSSGLHQLGEARGQPAAAAGWSAGDRLPAHR